MFAAGGAAGGQGELLTLRRSNLSFSALSSPPNQIQTVHCNLGMSTPSTFHHFPTVSSTTLRPILSLILTRTPSCSILGSDKMLKRLPRHLAVLLLYHFVPSPPGAPQEANLFCSLPTAPPTGRFPISGCFVTFFPHPKLPFCVVLIFAYYLPCSRPS